MRTRISIALFGVSLAAQNQQPVCTGITLDVDARCACVKDPKSDACGLVKKGFYEPHDWSKMKTMSTGAGNTTTPPSAVAPARTQAAPARSQQARVVPLAHKDYLRFLPANAQLAVGFDFEKLFQSPELMAAVFGQAEGEDERKKIIGAMKEMDHLWLSFSPPNDVVVLMTGKFELGVAAGMFYAQGVRPVFLGGAHAMMIGSEPSIQGALDRLAKPAPANPGWVARRAREMSKDHETWIVTEVPAGANRGGTVLTGIRQFAMGVRLSGVAGIDGEVVADSEASAQKVATWVEGLKAGVRGQNAVGALDSLMVEHTGATLRFAAKDQGLLANDAAKSAMNSELGVELYGVMMADFPGVPARTVAEEKLRAVNTGMSREEVLKLLGPPLTVSSIQGLDTPRETWTYQIPFGRQLSMRLDGGVVTTPPR